MGSVWYGDDFWLKSRRCTPDSQSMTTASLSNVSMANSISMAVASKQLDAARAEGQAINSLIESAASVAQASRGAVSASPGAGETGGGLDATA
jgi:hypothetical protein